MENIGFYLNATVVRVVRFVIGPLATGLRTNLRMSHRRLRGNAVDELPQRIGIAGHLSERAAAATGVLRQVGGGISNDYPGHFSQNRFFYILI